MLPFDNDIPGDHYVHRIRLASGEDYILDLTGVQFGPQWGLIRRAKKYYRLYHVASVMGTSPVGTEAIRSRS